MARSSAAQLVLMCTVCCGSIWLGLFFGLNYDEVVINNNFLATSCTVDTLAIVPRYCCRTTGACNQCNSTSATTTCVALFKSEEYKDPADCLRSPSATTCALQNIGCCNGYYCCRTCCSTCERCYSCGKNSRCCSTYQCNCYCCSSVANQYAVFTCPTCYSVVWTFIYNDNDGIRRTVPRVAEHDTNEAAAEATADYWYLGRTFNCWCDHCTYRDSLACPFNELSGRWYRYNPDDYTDIVYNLGYTTWKWVLTSFPTAFIMLIFVALTLPCVERCWRRCESSGDTRRQATLWTLGPLWTGLIIPIGLLLPISFAAIPASDQRALKVSICVMIVLSWSIGVRIWQKTKAAPSFIWLFYGVLVGIPWILILPICIYHQCGNAALWALSIIPIATACPFFFLFKVSVYTNRIDPLQTSTIVAPSVTSTLLPLQAELAQLRAANDALEQQLRQEQIAAANDSIATAAPNSLFAPTSTAPAPASSSSPALLAPAIPVIASPAPAPPSYDDATLVADI